MKGNKQSTAAAVFAILLCLPALARGNEFKLRESDSYHASLNQVLSDFSVPDAKPTEIKTFVLDEAGSCSPYYYVELFFPAKFEGQDFQLEIDLQALTADNMNRIAQAMRDNVGKFGLPNCVVTDTFDEVDWVSDELKKIVMVPASFKPNSHTCFGDELPYTNCVNVQTLYP